MKSIYIAEFYGDNFEIKANFAEASCQIEIQDFDGDWYDWGRQVADFQHSEHRAMTQYLREMSSQAGYDPDEADVKEEIENAIFNMI